MFCGTGFLPSRTVDYTTPLARQSCGETGRGGLDQASLASTCSGLHVLREFAAGSNLQRGAASGRCTWPRRDWLPWSLCIARGRNDQYQSGVPDSRIGCQRAFDSCLCCRRAAAARRAYHPVGAGDGLRDATVVVRELSVLGGSWTAERFDGRDSMLRWNLCFAD